MLDIDDNVPVLPATQNPLPSNIRRKSSLLVGALNTPSTDDDYSQEYSSNGHGLKSHARLQRNGTIDLRLDFNLKDLPALPADYVSPVSTPETTGSRISKDTQSCPSLNIVIMLVGSRGDIQPYVALGKELLKDGHRTFVTGQGLEFFSIGGNPQDLMSYMVKNPGLVPGLTSLTNGDILRKRKMLKEMIHGCWSSCTSPAVDTQRPFIAEAIIANPPGFAHIHCAEALGIPLLMSFSQTPTTSFSHPLVNITQSNGGYGTSNYLSYAMADLLTWQGTGDLINSFRTNTLGLPPLTLRTGPDILERLNVPWTYCMSPSLVPRPKDWRDEIDIVGFYFLDLATKYEAYPELAAFLEEGPTPIYIGFGSVVVDDPAGLSKIIFEATAQASTRAIVSSGWGGLGAVVHHGGAGTTAIGLAKGLPTVIVPFFGDQEFWGNMVHRAGAGPKPIPKAELSVKKLKDGIIFALSASAKESARRLAQRIKGDNGVQRGVESFYRHLPVEHMKCDLDPSRIAVWWSPLQCMKLSAFAAQTLVDANLVEEEAVGTISNKFPDSKTYDRKKPPSLEPQAKTSNSRFWFLTNGWAVANVEFSERVIAPWKKKVGNKLAVPISIAKSLGVERLSDLKPSRPQSTAGPTQKPTHKRSASDETPKSPPAVLKRAPRVKQHTRNNSAPAPNKLKKPPPPPVVIPKDPHQEAWKTDSHREAQKHIREFRVEQGHEAVRNSTEKERRDLISKYKGKLSPMGPQRREEVVATPRGNVKSLETQAGESTPPLDSSIESPDSPPTPGTSNELDEEAYEQQLERAIQLSLEQYRKQEGSRTRYGTLNTANTME
ncbi:glycosyltransferase family 28 domain-containing protein [Coprinopsis sp. MPI-PUGE-AT-0042]|nr:glycosyltransferase family 28 domain-containing protein [Coprinopsis sp. MPI-PUGE-AT-0042]